MRQRKSLGKETTFGKDIADLEELKEILHKLAEEVILELSIRGLRGRTVTIKIRYSNFKTVTRSRTRAEHFIDLADVLNTGVELLASIDIGSEAVRLLGISISGFEDDKPVQPSLFD